MPLYTTEMTWTYRTSLILARRRYGLRGGGGQLVAQEAVNKGTFPREASHSRPVAFFITCQSNGFWEGGWKKKYMQGALKVFLRA